MNFLTLNTKPFVLSVNSFARIYSQIHAEFIFCLVLRQALDLVQSEPKFTNEKITESLFKIFPGAVEINNAIHSLLDHCPSSTSCRLITIHIKGTWTIRVDCINTTDGSAVFVKLSAVLICWEKKNSLFQSHLKLCSWSISLKTQISLIFWLFSQVKSLFLDQTLHKIRQVFKIEGKKVLTRCFFVLSRARGQVNELWIGFFLWIIEPGP